MVQSNLRILIVDDEWNLRNLVRIYLNKSDYQLAEAQNGQEALTSIRKNHFDLIILDIMMPDMDGWEVCSKIRETKQTPILMLTARTDTKDKVHGLKIGADDYLVKPFAPEELVARVEALLRRSKHHAGEENDDIFVVYEDLTIDPDGRRILVSQQSIDFTPKEFDLLHFLAINPKRVFTRDILLDKIWGEDSLQDYRTVDTHIKNIREKVRKAGLAFNPIKTVWGVGYQFLSPNQSS